MQQGKARTAVEEEAEAIGLLVKLGKSELVFKCYREIKWQDLPDEINELFVCWCVGGICRTMCTHVSE